MWNKRTKNFESWITNITIKTEIRHKLHNDNKWIFVIPESIEATLNCKTNEPIDIKLEKTGILTLKNKCTLYTANTILVTKHNNYESKYKNIIPSINIIEDNCCKERKLLNFSNPEFIHLHSYNLDRESLKLTSYKLNQIDKLTEKLEINNENKNKWKELLKDNYFEYIICTILKLIFVYLVYKLFIYLKRKITKSESNNLNRCQLTNCLTFKMCNKNNRAENPRDTEIELEDRTNNVIETNDSNNEDNNERQPLRRSLRLSQIKSL